MEENGWSKKAKAESCKWYKMKVKYRVYQRWKKTDGRKRLKLKAVNESVTTVMWGVRNKDSHSKPKDEEELNVYRIGDNSDVGRAE
ncbi:hypothetical protein PoB_002522200 [Plakobranchus ocellatus]|uniref:Uncharacterized protein n=1 Tax=Plakobranchus ocellatus TaxID=259542 RepID=A0AAV3ZUE0_9GAST|nr:hypothetical protein PoB_002522200 [Plakobranchus ocellatus]